MDSFFPTDLPVAAPMRASPRRARAADLFRRAWLGVLIAGIIAVLVLPPAWTLLRTSLGTIQNDMSLSGLTLQNYADLFASPRLGTTALNSIIFATCATLVSLMFGGVLAWLVERTDVPLKGLAYLTTIISLGTPYI